MALRTFNPATGKWEVVATSQAVEVKVVDLEDNFESNNVEGCLRELKGIGNENLSKIEELLSDFADHVLNHPGGSGPGGPGGGGGTDIYVSVTTQMNTNILASITSQVIVEFDYDSSVKKDGTATITVNSILKNTRKVSIGSNSIDVTSFIEKGNNEVVIEVANAYGIKDSVIFNIDVVDLELTSSFNYGIPYADSIAFPYSIKGSVPKVIHFVMDGREIHTEQIRSTNTIQKVYTIPKQTHGVHKLKVYASSSMDSGELLSNTLEYEIICTDTENSTVLISSQFNISEIDQYSMLSIPFIVFDPTALTANVELKINNDVVSTLKVSRDEQKWNLTNYPAGETTFTIQCGQVKRDFVIKVNEVTIDVTEETNGLELYLSSNGRNNSEANRDIWEYNGISALFKNFNWVSDGWLTDENGFTALTVGGDSCVEIPFKPFEKDCRTLGKTIEIEFEVLDSIDYEASVISCMDNGRGFEISCRGAVIKSNETSTKTLFKDGERLRVSFCIEPTSSNRIIYTYIDGVVSGLTQYSVSDMFTQQQPATIKIGSSKCLTRIYNIRIYNNCLSTTSILNNYIYDKDDINSKINSYNKNNIYDSYGQIVYSRILNQIPCMTIVGTLPETKGDLKTVSVKFENKEDISKNIADPSVTIDVQGTSSQYFPRKNYLLTFNNPYQLRDNSIAVNTFCIKADFMESSHTHNTGLAKVIDGLYREKVPPQVENSRVRTTIDGYPIAIFYKETDSSTLKFYGIYNFNNDKSTHQVFGYGPNSECWEICNNTSQRVLFNESDYSSDEWQKDFQSRYPAKNTDYTNLKRLTDWLVEVKADQSRFKEEFREYFNPHYTFMYYLLTELFGMVDSRAKNMFLASWNKKIWYPVFYDMDTVLGLNNEGVLEFGYNIEYHDVIGKLNVYNGERSSLWNNIELCFEDEIGNLYRDLRNNSILTYEKVLKILLDEQIYKICEAQYNEDAKHKYLDPLTEKNISTFLYAAQGSRTNHLKYWLYNRINYMDSKYLSSAYKDNYITLRLYTPKKYQGVEPNADFKLTPYADQYVRVKYGSYEKFKRAKADNETLIEAPDIEFNDTETIIYGANRLSDIGDLSDKYAGTVDVSKATQLAELIIGSDAEGYNNSNLRELSLGNNKLLRKLNINNCTHLSQPLNVSGCTSIQEIYAKGTAITSIMLPEASGDLKILELPDSLTNLTVMNKPKLQILNCEGYDKINILRLENAGINALTVFSKCTNVEYVRLMNLDDRTGYIPINRLMKVKGMDEKGLEVPISQAVSGKITIASTSEYMLEIYKQAFPYVEFTVTAFSKSYSVTFRDGDGNTLYVDNVIENGEAVYNGPVPKKTSTNQYDFEWTGGWDRELKPIMSDSIINAAFTSILRRHRIRFIDPESDEIISDQLVFYGEMPEIPEFPEKYNYWGRIVEPVTEPTDYIAEYVPLPKDYTIFNFKDNTDGTVSCTLRSVSHLPSQVIVPFMYNDKYVTALSGENNVTGKGVITELYIPTTIKKWGSYIYTGCENLTFEKSSFPKRLPEGTPTHNFCYKWGGLTHVNFPEGVDSIGQQCFRECKNLVSINIPEGVTKVEWASFLGCTSLKGVDLPKSVRELTQNDIFHTSGIRYLNAPGVTKYTSSNTFHNVSHCVVSLGSVEYPVKTLYYDRIGKIVAVTTENGEFSDIVEGNVNKNNMFCTAVNTKSFKTDKESYIELYDDENDKVIMAYCFDKSITEYDLTDIAETGRSAYGPIMRDCFRDCGSLKHIDIPEGVTSLEDCCFYNCGKLKTINLSSTVTKLGESCVASSGLTELDTKNVTTLGYCCLWQMGNITHLNMPRVTQLNNALYSFNIKFISMGSKDYPVKSITGNNNFSGARCFIVTTKNGLRSDIELNGSSDRLYFTTLDSKWIKTEKEFYAELNDGVDNNKAVIGECLDRSITEYDLTDIGADHRTAYGPIIFQCFESCGGLIHMDIPEGVTELGDGCFRYCGKLSSINLSNSVTKIGGGCFQQAGLIDLDCKNTTYIGSQCFWSLPRLESLNMPKVTKLGVNVIAHLNNIKFISIGSKEHPVTHIAGGNNSVGGLCCIVTTKNGLKSDVEIESASDNYYFTTMSAKWVRTEKEYYAELTDGVDNNNKAIMGRCLDKSVTEYDLTDIGPDHRTAYGPIVRYCFESCGSLKHIDIPEGVTKIGGECFRYCGKLSSINLSSTVTHIGGWCFQQAGLTSIDTKNVIDLGDACFYNTPRLEYINLPKVSVLRSNTVAHMNNIKFIAIGSEEYPVKIIQGGNNSLGRCCIVTTKNGLKSDVEIESASDNYYFTTMSAKWVKTEKEIYAELNDGDDNTKALMGECFDKSVTSYDLSHIANTNRVAYGPIVRNCFSSCGSLKHIDIPEGVSRLDYECFSYCGKLETINLSSTITSLGQSCFYQCYKLTSIDTKNVISIGWYCFSRNNALEFVSMPKMASLPKNTFEYCEPKYMSMGSKDCPVTSIGINNNPNVIFIVTTQNGLKSDVEMEFTSNRLYFTNMDVKWVKTEKEIYAELNDGDDNTKALMVQCRDKTVLSYNLTDIGPDHRTAYGPIAQYCFYGCEKLKHIDIPEGVTELGVECFRACNKLASVNLSSSVTTLGQSCFHTAALTSIDSKNVTSIGSYCFSRNPLVYINLPKISTLNNGVFEYCNSIKFIALGSIEHPVTYIGSGNNTASMCWIVTTRNGRAEDVDNKLTSWQFYYTTKNAKWVATENEYYAEISDRDSDNRALIGECINKNITSYNLNDIGDDHRVAYGAISANCFRDCTKLTHIDIPEGVDLLMGGCFYNCKALTRVSIPGGVTGLMGACFMNCVALTQITIPEGVTHMDDQSFSGCTKLVNVSLPNSLEVVSDRCFMGCSSLASISMGVNVTTVGKWAFSNTSSMRSVTILGPVSIGAEAFSHSQKPDGIRLGSAGKPVRELNSTTFKFLNGETTVTLCTQSGNENDLPGSPWGAGNNVRFVFERA